MKLLFCLALSVLILSCNLPAQQTNNCDCDQKIGILNDRIDSLVNVLHEKDVSSKKGVKTKKQSIHPLYSSKPVQKQTKTLYSGGGRCQATTKKGSQCSRTVKSGSYCWQHS